jgi:hypothetical protein
MEWFAGLIIAGLLWHFVGRHALMAANVPPPSARQKTYPIMTMEMIDSKGGPITKTQAVTVFKQYMQAVGYLDKDELVEHAGYFLDEMAMHEECLIQDAVSELDDLKEQLKALRSQRKGETDAETKADLDDEISSIKDDIQSAELSNKPAKDALAAFKKDKRQFLIDYVNHQVQGS